MQQRARGDGSGGCESCESWKEEWRVGVGASFECEGSGRMMVSPSECVARKGGVTPRGGSVTGL